MNKKVSKYKGFSAGVTFVTVLHLRKIKMKNEK